MRRFFETKAKSIFTLVILLALALGMQGQVGQVFGATTSTNGSVNTAAVTATTTATTTAAANNATVDQLKQQQQQLADKLVDLKKQIAQYGQQIDQNRKSQNTLKGQITSFDNEIISTELQLQVKQTEIEDANLQIKALQEEIDRKKAEIEKNKQVLGQLIVQLNQLDANSALYMGLGNKNFSDFLDQVQYNHSVSDSIYQLLKRIQEIKAKLEAQQKDLEQNLQKLQALQEQLQITQSALQGQRKQKQGLLDQTRGLERNYQKLRLASEADEAKIQQEMEDLNNNIREKLGQRTIHPAKGVLACPISGRITQGYGNTGFTALGYTFHAGIDVAAPAGTVIYAPADGIVVGADTGEAAYGNWVAIEHTIETASGNRKIVSLNAHMQGFKVQVEQEVHQGDVIGYEGNTGNTTRLIRGPEYGFHDHIAIFDKEGFGIAPGKYTEVYGPYTVPFGYTYDPRTFMSC